MKTDVIAGVEDLRVARERFGGYCTRGSSAWFASHGLSFREFLQNGYPASRLRVDDLGNRVADIAEERAVK